MLPAVSCELPKANQYLAEFPFESNFLTDHVYMRL